MYDISTLLHFYLFTISSSNLSAYTQYPSKFPINLITFSIQFRSFVHSQCNLLLKIKFKNQFNFLIYYIIYLYTYIRARKLKSIISFRKSKSKILHRKLKSILTNQNPHDTISIHETKKSNPKRSDKIQMENLIWKIDNENHNGGYWVCSCCGVKYGFPKNWIPKASYCMKCKAEWR